MIKKLILGREDNIQKKEVIWNIIASSIAAVQSALMLIIVTRVVSLEDAGMFSLAYSIAQMMLTIGYFDMRAYQVTDVKGKIQFKHYFTSRLLTCLLMMAVSVFYIFVKQYTGYKAAVIFFACLYKMTEAFEDVLHALFQKSGRLDVAGKLQSLRLLSGMLIFAVVLVITGDILTALVIASLVSIVLAVVMNFPFVRMFERLQVDFDWKKLGQLMLACLPLFIGSYLALYMENSPKYAIDKFLAEADQAYYGMLAMTAYVVNLFSGFAFRPMLTPLALRWEHKEYRQYLKIIVKLFAIILGILVVILAGAYILGIPVLSLLYGKDLSNLKWVMMVIILAGGFNAIGTIIYYTLTIMRKQTWLLGGYVVTAIAAYFAAPWLVQRYKLMGAAAAFALVMALRTLIFSVMILICFREAENAKKDR